MKIAIINDVHIGKPLMHGNTVRASSDGVISKFESFLSNIVRQHQPDLLINLGDLIRSESADLDSARYCHLMNCYKSVEVPVVHLIGNHEIKRLQCNEIETVWNTYGFNQHSYGHRSLNGVDIIWLAIEEEKESKTFYLPINQLHWLEESLQKSVQPILIFIHCPLDDHDVSGNFFYEALDDRKKDALFLKNQNEVRKIIQSRKNVVAVFQAHLHYFYTRLMDGIAYITCPAMNDNICGPDITNNNPEIYTIATLLHHKVMIKAYSREYSFTGFEMSI